MNSSYTALSFFFHDELELHPRVLLSTSIKNNILFPSNLLFLKLYYFLFTISVHFFSSIIFPNNTLQKLSRYFLSSLITI